MPAKPRFYRERSALRLGIPYVMRSHHTPGHDWRKACPEMGKGCEIVKGVGDVRFFPANSGMVGKIKKGMGI